MELTCTVALLGLIGILPLRTDATWVDWCLYFSIAALLGVMALLRPRFPAAAGFVGGFGFIQLVTTAAWFRQGLASGVTSAAYALAVVVGGLLWGPRKTVVLALIASGGAALLAWQAPKPATAPLRSWAELTAILITMALFVELLLGALGERITEARSSRKRFQQLFDGSPDALFVLDRRGTVQLTNRQARDLAQMEVPPGTALSSLALFKGPNALLLPIIIGTEVDTGIQRLPLGPEASEPLSMTPGRYHDLTASRLASELGDMLLLTVRDITEHVGASRARREFEAQLAKSKSLEALGRLAGGVAHDFNNLLTVIIGTTDLLLQAPVLESQTRTDLSGIKASATKAAELTSQLLAFGRKQILAPTLFCPNDGLSQLQPLLERLVPADVTLTIHLEPTLKQVRADSARLDQVVINLVTNACEAMPEGGELRIDTSNLELQRAAVAALAGGERETIAPGHYVCVSVSDTGTGMSDETLGRMFEPFFTTKTLGKGTGLGLATAFGIVRQSGGYIRVSSKLGQGTRFELLFPQADSVYPDRISTERGSGKPLSILLVESNPAVRASVAQMLEALRHRVTVAANADQALTVAHESEQQFDVLISEVVMPDANGAHLAAALSRLHPNLLVLLLANSADPVTAGDSIAPGLSRRIQRLAKPFTKRALDEKLRALFAGGERAVG